MQVRGAQAKEGRETLESLFLNEIFFIGYFSMVLFYLNGVYFNSSKKEMKEEKGALVL